MKNQIFKAIVSVLLIIALTMTNFIFVGASFISYAADTISTNQSNIGFSAYFKDGEGKELTTKETNYKQTEDYLYVRLEVKKEGYLTNAKITLQENSNFELVSSQSDYVEKVEGKEIILHNLTAGTNVEIPIKIKPVREEKFNTGLLNMESALKIEGTYKDSSEKDKKVEAQRKVELIYAQNITEQDILNEINVITNKIDTINGEQKRVVQLLWQVGLKENNYPIEKIEATIEAPTVQDKEAKTEQQISLNTMTSSEYKNENDKNIIKLENKENEDKKVEWKTNGAESIILTYIYNKDINLDNVELNPQIKIKLYNQKEQTATSKITIGSEEKDGIVEISTKNQSDEIYKSKDQYITTTALKVNLAKVVETIKMQENQSTYKTNEQETEADIEYKRTLISKEQFDKILGEEGKITITTLEGEVLGEITSKTTPNTQGYLTIRYDNKSVKAIKIETSKPITEGTIYLNHIKTINKTQEETQKQAEALENTITYTYNEEQPKQAKNSIKLLNTMTEAKITTNQTQLSTIVTNDLEMKVQLLSNNEKYDLWENPEITINLPEQVENIQIKNIQKLYDDNQEFGDPSYEINGRQIKINLAGKQNQYKTNTSVEGITIVIEAKIVINKKAATSDESIGITYVNQKALTYVNNATANTAISIVAPKDITTVNSIKELSAETLGEEKEKTIIMPKSSDQKQVEAQIEVINSNKSAINDVKILGKLPTNNSKNNMGITLAGEIQVKQENAKIYYTENENATDDLEKTENNWKENIQDAPQAKKYLIVAKQIASQSSIEAKYPITIPANLEYNEKAEQEYTITATNNQTKSVTKMNSSKIILDTGVGPVLETKIVPMVGNTTLENNATVKTGEVIKYKLEVTNTGSENVETATIEGKIPEGTTPVEPMKYYEYTGAEYYQETSDVKTATATINNLEVGKTKTLEYEVRVNNNTAEGAKIRNEAKLTYGEVTKTSTIENTVEKADIRVSIKRITNRETAIYTGDIIEYFAIIENISNEEQKNVTINTNISDNLNVEKVELKTGVKAVKIEDDDVMTMEELQGNLSKEGTNDVIELPEAQENTDTVTTKELDYASELNIGTLAKGETKVLAYTTTAKNSQEEKASISITAKNGKTESKSNLWEDEIMHYSIESQISTNTESQFIKIGDEVDYTITLINTGNAQSKLLMLSDIVPEELEIENISINGKEQETSETNNIEIPCVVDSNSKTEINIKSSVAYHENQETKAITNKAEVALYGEVISTTPEITHILQANSGESEGETNPVDTYKDPDQDDNGEIPGEGNGSGSGDTQQPTNPEVPSEPSNPSNDNDIANGQRMIVGTVWNDANGDGKKDASEARISDVKVKLLNVETNNLVKDQYGQAIEVKTNSSGVYIIENLKSGKYIAIFEYDTTKYKPTTYKASGIAESDNSNVVSNELNIEGKTSKVSSTDIIEIKENDISNINLGLIELKNFDLELKKYVSRILIQDSTGTKVTQFDNSELAKVELNAKTLKGSTVLIEYSITVTNKGEIEGYAKNIVDYKPNDLNFSSEINTDWYMQDGALHNTSLANEKIPVGESRTITLTLTKSMTSDNVGRTTNIAEIAQDYNELGIKDSNSIPSNRIGGENDQGQADVILSIKTGGAVYAGIIIIAVIVLSAIIFIIIKRKTHEEI